jgi:hypothetical protein
MDNDTINVCDFEFEIVFWLLYRGNILSLGN